MPEHANHKIPLATAVFVCLIFGFSLLIPPGFALAQNSVITPGDAAFPRMQSFNTSVPVFGPYPHELQIVRDRIRQLLIAVDRNIASLEGRSDSPAELVTEATDSFRPVFDVKNGDGVAPAVVALSVNPATASANWSLIGYAGMLWRNITDGDAWTLLLVALVSILALTWLLLPSRRPKEYQQGSKGADFSMLALDSTAGVTVVPNDTVASIDVDDEPWYSQTVSEDHDQELTEQDEVDLITQSDVYLAYGRTMQAIEVLLEEYEKSDSDRFVVAAKLIKVYRKMGDDSDRNVSMRTFITRLNQDIDLFSGTEWHTLREELDNLRREEHLLATGHPAHGISPSRHRTAVRSMDVAYDSKKAAYS